MPVVRLYELVRSLVGLVAMTTCVAWAQLPAAPAVTDAMPSPAAPAPPTTTSSRPHPVTLAAVQQGVLACSARINQVAQFLGVNDSHGALLIPAPAQQDQRLTSVILEMPSASTGHSAYVSATFAPNQANGCGAGYEAVAYWPRSCDEVGRLHFGTLKGLGRLKKDIVILDGGHQLKVFLLPAGSGCVSIKREVLS